MTNNSIYITGASGFVGSSLTLELDRRDFHDVTLIQRKQPEPIAIGVKHYPINDISDNLDYSSLFKVGSIVIHMAALAHVMFDENNAARDSFYKVNVEATVNLAKYAARCGVRRFIFLSSAGVNGSSSCSPFTEESEVAPHDCYTKSKFEAELKLKEISKNTDMELVIIRPPLVYGADAGGSFGKLLRLVSTGVPLPFGSVNNHRSLIYVKNLVDFIVCCIQHPAAKNQTFLVSDGDDVSLRDLIRYMHLYFGMHGRLYKFPILFFRIFAKLTRRERLLESLVGDLQVDCIKARSMLGWTPPYEVKGALSETINLFSKKGSI